jgi:hypothetical protein
MALYLDCRRQINFFFNHYFLLLGTAMTIQIHSTLLHYVWHLVTFVVRLEIMFKDKVFLQIINWSVDGMTRFILRALWTFYSEQSKLF